jgi:hypothetical protein
LDLSNFSELLGHRFLLIAAFDLSQAQVTSWGCRVFDLKSADWTSRAFAGAPLRVQRMGLHMWLLGHSLGSARRQAVEAR